MSFHAHTYAQRNLRIDLAVQLVPTSLATPHSAKLIRKPTMADKPFIVLFV